MTPLHSPGPKRG